jgi:quercetin dioxygenase-like cupin family protein
VASRYTINEAKAFSYSPANHSGTLNRRLIGEKGLESRQMEVLRGTLEPSCGALPHAHPGMEQAVYVISGTAQVVAGDEKFSVGPGDCCHFPADVLHSFVATGDKPAEILVIYTPPYGERKEKVFRPDSPDSHGG